MQYNKSLFKGRKWAKKRFLVWRIIFRRVGCQNVSKLIFHSISISSSYWNVFGFVWNSRNRISRVFLSKISQNDTNFEKFVKFAKFGKQSSYSRQKSVKLSIFGRNMLVSRNVLSANCIFQRIWDVPSFHKTIELIIQ